MIVAALAVVIGMTVAAVVREALWLRRVQRASGDPEALEQILGQRRRWR